MVACTVVSSVCDGHPSTLVWVGRDSDLDVVHAYTMLNEITGGAEPYDMLDIGLALSAVDTLLITSLCLADALCHGTTHVGV